MRMTAFQFNKEPGAILRDRANALAKELQESPDKSDFLEVIEFDLADESYAIATDHVLEVYPFDFLTPLPGTKSFISGITNVRGRILAVLDIKKFFDLPAEGIADSHQILVVTTPEMDFGLLADKVAGIRQVPRASIQPPLPTFIGVGKNYITGVTAERVVILDPLRISADPTLLVQDEMEQG
ncbi:MAG: chemotaxis protein CheW [Verrucomicrobiota bacterium]